MVYFPPAKLNLGLHILSKRPDGFHDLESVFLPLRWTDMLEVTLDDEIPAGEARFEWSGLNIPGNASDNLVARAHRLLAEKHDLPGLSIHLHKILPMSPQELAHDAGLLGSDCPFFVQDGTALVQGRGEHVTPIDLSSVLDGCHVVVANPGIHIGTAEAFAHVTPQTRVTDWQALADTPLNQWHLHLRNDFEAGIRAQHRAVDELLTWMAEAGADHVQMTGTGSTVFGLFKDRACAKRAETVCKEARQGLVWKGQC